MGTSSQGCAPPAPTRLSPLRGLAIFFPMIRSPTAYAVGYDLTPALRAGNRFHHPRIEDVTCRATNIVKREGGGTVFAATALQGGVCPQGDPLICDNNQANKVQKKSRINFDRGDGEAQRLKTKRLFSASQRLRGQNWFFSHLKSPEGGRKSRGPTKQVRVTAGT